MTYCRALLKQEPSHLGVGGQRSSRFERLKLYSVESHCTLWDSGQSDRSGRLSELKGDATARHAAPEQERVLLRTHHPVDVVLVVNKAAKPRRRGTATPENAISTAQPLSDAAA